ncbi:MULTISPECIES: DUF1304 domain-containing protein [unclassified Luteococcus]|uniref:DUF1304 domain-containing protein n=1 Tax=unclassified Luteococcus TaxID=2639923 RepID=UPI00313D99AB
MPIAAVLVLLACLLHVYIWYLESLAWTTAARKVFGTSVEEAEATREMAFNQGFYNLFLAIAGLAGVVALVLGHTTVAVTLMVTAVGSMAAAALLLLLTSPEKRGAAVKQGFFPVLALVALGLAALA